MKVLETVLLVSVETTAFVSVLLLSHFSFHLFYKGWQRFHALFRQTSSLSQTILGFQGEHLRLFRWTAAILLFASGYMLSHFSLLFATLLGGIGYIAPLFVISIFRTWRLRKFDRQLAPALDGLANFLRAGFTLIQAIEQLTKDHPPPLSEEFSVVLQEHRLGITLDQALEHLSSRVGSKDLSLAVTATIITRSLGGNLAEIFQKIATTVRDRWRLEEKVRALTSQGKLQGIIVGALPFGLGLALHLMEPQFMRPLFTTPSGMVCMGIILLMETSGMILIWKIVQIVI